MISDTQYGLLVDYEYCTGCHSCEVACIKEHNLPPDQYGIRIFELGPWERRPDHWEWLYVPSLSSHCDLCDERVTQGKLPSCVHHCQGFCLSYGPLSELLTKMDAPRKLALLKP